MLATIMKHVSQLSRGVGAGGAVGRYQMLSSSNGRENDRE